MNIANPGSHQLNLSIVDVNNTGSDQNASNDVINKTFTTGLSGIKTITQSGGADFTSINSALSYFNNGGLIGPLTLKLIPGTYNETIEILPYKGLNINNPLVIDGSNASNICRFQIQTLMEMRFSFLMKPITTK